MSEIADTLQALSRRLEKEQQQVLAAEAAVAARAGAELGDVTGVSASVSVESFFRMDNVWLWAALLALVVLGYYGHQWYQKRNATTAAAAAAKDEIEDAEYSDEDTDVDQ